MPLQHAYTQTVADGTATSVVRPSDWNSAHVLNYQLSGNTVGASTASGTNIVYQAGNNVTLSVNQGANAATIVFSGANTVAQDGVNIVGMAPTGVGNGATAGATQTATTGTVYLQAGNNMTLSQNGNSIVVSAKNHPEQITIGGNTAGVGAAISTGTFFIAGGNNVTISQNGNSLSINAPAPGGGAGTTVSFYEPNPIVGTAAGTASSLGQNTIHFVPIKPLQNVTMTVINMFASNAVASAATASYARSHTIQYGLYSLGTGTNNTNIYTVGTSTMNVFMSGNSSNASCGLTIQGAGSTFTQTVASSSGMTQWASNKIFQMPFAASMAEGNEYYFAMAVSTNSAGSNAGFTMSHVVLPALTNASWGRFGPGLTATNLVATAVSNIPNFAGFIYSATSAALPATIALSQRSQMVSNARMYIQMDA